MRSSAQSCSASRSISTGKKRWMTGKESNARWSSASAATPYFPGGTSTGGGELFRQRSPSAPTASPGLADQVDRDGRRSLRCGAGVVDNVVDDANTPEGDGQHVVQLDPRRVRDLEATPRVHRRVDVEEALAQTPTLVRLDGVGHLVRDVAWDVALAPSRLIRRIIRSSVGPFVSFDRNQKTFFWCWSVFQFGRVRGAGKLSASISWYPCNSSANLQCRISIFH